jgi:polyhydroxyalkanoate synthesis regulator phasin
MRMEETAEPTKTSRLTGFKESLVSLPHTIDERLPTMDKSLDRYFDSHISAIIDEWGLITQHNLDDLEHRLNGVRTEIRNLEKGQTRLEKRAADLEAEITRLEGS